MQFHIERMACGGCARTVTEAIKAIDSNAKVETDTVAKTVKVETSLTSDEIGKTLADVGYPATVQ